MSDQAQTLTPEQEAETILYDEVILPTFEAKCAANGRSFSSADEVVKGYMSAQRVKEAASRQGGGVVAAADADLCRALGIPTEEEKQADAVVQEQTETQASDARIQAAFATLSAAGQS